MKTPLYSENKFSSKFILRVIVLFLVIPAVDSQAGKVDVINVEVETLGGNRFRFAVAVRHADSGWSHYADRWEVLSPSRKILGTRMLYHPHVHEQPFTCSLNITIPPGIRTVVVRARDKKHGFGGAEKKVSSTRARSPDDGNAPWMPSPDIVGPLYKCFI